MLPDLPRSSGRHPCLLLGLIICAGVSPFNIETPVTSVWFQQRTRWLPGADTVGPGGPSCRQPAFGNPAWSPLAPPHGGFASLVSRIGTNFSRTAYIDRPPRMIDLLDNSCHVCRPAVRPWIAAVDLDVDLDRRLQLLHAVCASSRACEISSPGGIHQREGSPIGGTLSLQGVRSYLGRPRPGGGPPRPSVPPPTMTSFVTTLLDPSGSVVSEETVAVFVIVPRLPLAFM